MSIPGPDGMPALLDAGNPLLSFAYPANLVTGKIPAPDGERGVATIRQANTTMTVMLTRDEAAQWAEMFAQLRDALSGKGLVIPVRGQAVRIADAVRQPPPRHPG